MQGIFSQEVSRDSVKTGRLYKMILYNDNWITGEILSSDSVYIKIKQSNGTAFKYAKQQIKTFIIPSKEDIEDYYTNKNKSNIKESTMPDKNKFVWFNFGIGGDNNGISYGASLNYRVTSISMLTFRFIKSEELDGLLSTKTPNESLNEFSFLYGIYYKTKKSLLSISAGGGVIYGTLRGDFLAVIYNGWFSSTQYYEEIKFSAVSLPLQAQLLWTPTDSYGIGLYGYANINKNKRIVGCMLSIAIGLL
jgi:hypothetical protein